MARLIPARTLQLLLEDRGGGVDGVFLARPCKFFSIELKN
jgi:hypothetical protein